MEPQPLNQPPLFLNQSSPPYPDPPASIPRPASTFTIKPIKILQFIAEIWFLCRAFARFLPITCSITSCCEQGGVTGVGLQLLNMILANFLLLFTLPLKILNAIDLFHLRL
ncbi:hypothetical protein SLE2022_028320 [Rubroshorea leprosula]